MGGSENHGWLLVSQERLQLSHRGRGSNWTQRHRGSGSYVRVSIGQGILRHLLRLPVFRQQSKRANSVGALLSPLVRQSFLKNRPSPFRGLPRQLWLMKENGRRSILFHLLVPGGK